MKTVFAFLIVLACVIVGLTLPLPASKPLPGSVVRVVLEQGHGSAVHIGGGYFVTADHVVRKEGKFTLEIDDGSKTEQPEILWTHKGYDLALLLLKGQTLDRSPLSCIERAVGTDFEAVGNPFDLGPTRTYGKIAGPPRQYAYWKSVYVVDGRIGPGMSGGAVLDRAGQLIGITVGGIGSSFAVFGLIVPSTVVCNLMARA